MDEPLRNALLSALDLCVLSVIEDAETSVNDTLIERFLTSLWVDHYKLRFKSRPSNFDEWHEYINDRLQRDEWYEIYDFIEYSLQNFPFSISEVEEARNHFKSLCNIFLKREMSAWRIVGNQLARLTSDEEIEAVEKARNLRGPVATHITTAVGLMSDRRNPDYRNSIKESISAVEAMCCIITEKPKATLDEALKALEQKDVRLHGALKKAFSSLYGYTSDAQGIRHKLIEDPQTDFEDAKFMLVSCSAFVNLLRARLGPVRRS